MKSVMITETEELSNAMWDPALDSRSDKGH